MSPEEKVNKVRRRLLWCCVLVRTNIRFASNRPQTTHFRNFSCYIINFSLLLFTDAVQLSFWLCCVLIFKFNLSICCCWRESEYWISIPNQISAILSDFAVWASQFNLTTLRGVLQCDLHFFLPLLWHSRWMKTRMKLRELQNRPTLPCGEDNLQWKYPFSPQTPSKYCLSSSG